MGLDDGATHAWPPHLDIPDASWRDGYALLATEVGIDVTDVETAAAEVRAFVAEIASAQPTRITRVGQRQREAVEPRAPGQVSQVRSLPGGEAVQVSSTERE